MNDTRSYELVYTDGYSIDRTIYPSKDAAREAMAKAYNELNSNEKGDRWDEASYLGEEDALLYQGGINVHCWSVFPCMSYNEQHQRER